MGVGKTTIGKLTAEKLGKLWIDTDEKIKNKVQMEISDFVSLKGEQAFRHLETDLLLKISQGTNQIISLGGGTFIKVENRELVQASGKAIYLFANYRTIVSRLLPFARSRPLISGNSKSEILTRIYQLYQDRLSVYQSADFRVITDQRSISEVSQDVEEIIKNEDSNFNFTWP